MLGIAHCLRYILIYATFRGLSAFLLSCNCHYIDYLTPWNGALLERIIVIQVVKKFPAFYGTQRFIAVFTRADHCPILSQMHPVHNLPPSFHEISSNIVLSLDLNYTSPFRLLVFPANLPCGDSLHSLFQISYPFSIAYVVPKKSVHFRGPVYRFVTSYRGEKLLAPHPSPKLEDHPLSAYHDCLFNIFAANHIWRPSPPYAAPDRSMPNQRL